MFDNAFTFHVKTFRFDEDYVPAENTRLTTNFANLARGETRRENLRKALQMIDNRCNALAHWDNPNGQRYAVELDIISVDMNLPVGHVGEKAKSFPMVELLKTGIVDKENGTRIDGAVGNNFSSYVRDYDFSILLREVNKDRDAFFVPADFGDLHGKLFRHFLDSDVYRQNFGKPPLICLSASSTRTYHRTQNHHPILGVEYRQDQASLTDRYFAKMGLKVRYFMPRDAAAPLAFYFAGDLLNDYTNLELIGTISTIASGRLRLSYCAASTRNTNSTHRGNTSSAVLPEISC